MKRVIIVFLIVAMIGLVCVAYHVGNYHGRMEAITNSVFYIVDFDEPVVFNGIEYDTSLFIELDGNKYEQGLFVC